MAAEPDSELGQVFTAVIASVAGSVSVAAMAGMEALPFKPGPNFQPIS